MSKTINCRSKKGQNGCPYHGQVYSQPSYDRVKQALSKAYTNYSTATMDLKHQANNPVNASKIYLDVHEKAIKLWEAEDLHDSTDEGFEDLKQTLITLQNEPEQNKMRLQKLENRLNKATLIRKVLNESENRLREVRDKIENSKFLTPNKKIAQLQQAIIIERTNIESEKVQYKIKNSQISYDTNGIAIEPNEELLKRNLLSYAIVQNRLNEFGHKAISQELQ